MHLDRMPSTRPRRLMVAGAAAMFSLIIGSTAVADTLEEQLSHGGQLYAEYCAVCHGEAGEGGAGYPNAIVGSSNLNKFRNAKRLFDYHRMMMPFDDPSKMTAEEKWDVTAYLMDLNDWLGGLDAPLGPDNAEDIAIGSD